MARLPRKFYERSTLKVAPELLGHFLVRQGTGNKEQVTKRKTIITDVEAYVGEGDPACHASRGQTERNKIMYGRAGHAYVYFIYGMYHCLNVVTEREGFPAAVLIRGVSNKEQGTSNKREILNGPGKLCRELRITKGLNGTDLVMGQELWIEKNPERNNFLRSRKIKKTPRVGISAGRDKLWRWVIES